jgi:hypothetical protein
MSDWDASLRSFWIIEGALGPTQPLEVVRESDDELEEALD